MTIPDVPRETLPPVTPPTGPVRYCHIRHSLGEPPCGRHPVVVVHWHDAVWHEIPRTSRMCEGHVEWWLKNSPYAVVDRIDPDVPRET